MLIYANFTNFNHVTYIDICPSFLTEMGKKIMSQITFTQYLGLSVEHHQNSIHDVSYPAPTRVERVPFEGGGKDMRAGVESQKGGDGAGKEDEKEKDFEEGDVNVEYKGRKSGLSVGKYIVKSTVKRRGDKKIRVWICPYEKCYKNFSLSRKCGAHLNEHLNRYSECPTCLYKLYSLDGYEHHICFKGLKTQGEWKYTKPKRIWSEKSEEGEKTEKRRKTVPTATVSKPDEQGEDK